MPDNDCVPHTVTAAIFHLKRLNHDETADVLTIFELENLAISHDST